MKNILKHIFIPHKHNDYKPHFFRGFAVSIMFLSVVFLFITSLTSSMMIRNTKLGAAVLMSVLLDLTNESRTENQAPELAHSTVLDTAANLKANDMVTQGYFAHVSPKGVTPWAWFYKAGYFFKYAGENLAVDFTESKSVERAWMRSPGHRANILNTKFTEVGIAVVKGTYKGHDSIFVVQMFGTPLAAYKPTVAVPQSASALDAVSGIDGVQLNEAETLVLAPSVQGAFTTSDAQLQTIVDTEEFIAVENVSAGSIATDFNIKPIRSTTWIERFLVNESKTVGIIFSILAIIVGIALLLMIGIEIKRQHPKQIAYGVFLLIILLVLMYVNRTFFVITFLA